MRTLKKALCLVLVLCMVFSLCAVGASATSFSDDAKITAKYDEAVEVLSGLKVINGMNDAANSFAPQGTLTRAQAVVIITKLLNADVAAASGKTVFTDVPATHWASKYVSYCYDSGLISGNGDGTFGPDDQLTGYQFALMLMRALGYDPTFEEIGGSDWQLDTAKLALNIGIADGELLAAKPFTREMACQMAFNTLKAYQVKYDKAVSITGDTTTTTKFTKATPYGKTLGSDVFGLTSISTYDVWGRPATTWSGKAIGASAVKTIATVPEVAAATYTAAVKECDIASVLGYDTNKENMVTTYTNGKVNNSTTYINAVDTTTKIGAQGRLVEVYKAKTDVNGKVIHGDIIVMIDTLLAQVTGVKDAKFDTAGHIISNSALTLSVYDAATNAANVPGTSLYQLDGGKTNFDYKVGDFILINAVARSATTNKVATGMNKYAEVVGLANSITGAQTTIWYNSDQHTIAGTTYNDANTFYLDEAQKTTTDHTWFFDSYGNLIGSTLIKSAKTYGTISAIWWYNDGTNGGVGDCYATIVAMDGTTSSVKINSIDGYKTTYVGNLGQGAGTITGTAYNTTTNPGYIYISTFANNNAAAVDSANTKGLVAKHLYEITTRSDGKLDLVSMTHLSSATVNTQLSIITDVSGASVRTNSATQYLIYNTTAKTFSTASGWNEVLNYSNVPVCYVANTSTGYVAYAFIIGDPYAQPNGKLVYVDNPGSNYDPATQVYTIYNVTVNGVSGQAVQTKDINVVSLLCNNVDSLFYVDFAGEYAVMSNNLTGSQSTVKLDSTNASAAAPFSTTELGSNVSITYLAGAWLTNDGLSDSYPVTPSSNVYNVTGITPAVGVFEADMSTRGVYLVHNNVGVAKVVTAAYVTDAKNADIQVLGNSNVTLIGLADTSVVTTAPVAHNTPVVGAKINIVATRTGSSTFAANSTFVLTLSNGRTVTATTDGAPEEPTLIFEYEVLPSDVTSYTQILSVLSITKL